MAKSFIEVLKELSEEVNREIEEEKRQKEARKNEGGFLGQILTGTFGPFEDLEEKPAKKKPTPKKQGKKLSPLGDNGDKASKERQSAREKIREDKEKIEKSRKLSKKKRLRQAIVTAEILGKPVSKRR